MLRWATARRARQVARGAAPGSLTTVAAEADRATVNLLTQHSFAPLNQFRLHLRRVLTGDLPAPLLPNGSTLRQVREDELAARVALHRAVWHPSRVTLPAYRRLRATAGYAADLDLIAVAPDGTLAAYCICWHDPVNQTGLFEPLGTAAAYRRHGLARAIVREGLRRLAVRGARVALVAAESVNPAAVALYDAEGFRLASRQRYYARADGAPGL